MSFYCILYLRNFATNFLHFCLDLEINALLIKYWHSSRDIVRLSPLQILELRFHIYFVILVKLQIYYKATDVKSSFTTNKNIKKMWNKKIKIQLKRKYLIGQIKLGVNKIMKIVYVCKERERERGTMGCFLD